nr:glycosyltransferase family 4 protein [Acidobacteriota bacterium]
AYDILNVHEPSGAAAAMLRRVSARPRIIVTSHGIERRAWDLAREEARLGRGGPSRRARLWHPLTVLSQARFALSLADHVLVLNSDDRAYLIDRLGRRPETVTRIWPGASEVYARAAVTRDYGAPRAILFSGTWRANKGIADLVPAMRRVWQSRPDVTLTVLGAGADPAVIHAAFGDARVRVETAASDEAAAAVYGAHDLFVLPSLFEGTPLTLIEAMAGGLPCVTTRTCGMKDVVRDGENGLLVPVRDPEALARALLLVVETPALAARLGRAAAADAAACCTWSEAARPVLSVYESVDAFAPA